MDLVNSFLNFILDRISQTAFAFIFPVYLFFKSLIFIIRSTFAEDVAGKVVLITGASSGIGEHMAYEYAKRGAYLALVARRDNRLREVADVAEILGSPYALVIHGDVSNIEDCKRCVDTTVTHFGRLDYLVNNAGITSINLFEEYDDPRNVASVMDIDFWGTVYSTYYAIPYLKQSRGKIIGIASSAAWLPTPRLSFYTASKAAVISFYETLRVEIGREIGITIVTPGLIESEMTRGKFIFEDGKMYLDQELRDAVISVMPIEPVGGAVEACWKETFGDWSENVTGKVVLITGASSGIGQHLAYEYAKRGAYLALVARRENRLREVAAVAEFLGSPYTLVIPTDISRIEDCKRCIQTTVTHFGRLDHLVNNAGISSINLFEEYDNLDNVAPVMDVNFWGMVYCTYYAIPHLMQNRGKIIGISSSAAWLPVPRLSFYSASKAAVISFYETLRVEVGREISITIVTPGLIESEMTQGKFMSKEGRLYLDQELRNAMVRAMPIMPIGDAVKGIVRSACRGDRYATEPPWMRMAFYYKTLWPELVEWFNYLIIMTGSSPTDTFGKRLLELTGLKTWFYPESVRSPELGLKTE